MSESALPILVSHHLCPYVQRAAIVAAERGITITREFVDLAAKPDWFLALSPTGKVPLLAVRDAAGTRHILFESAAIAEYLDETTPGDRLMPGDPLARAATRAWVEYASGTLAEIAGLYNAPNAASFDGRVAALQTRFAQLDTRVARPWFAGETFGLVDAAFGPVFRYCDAFERLAGLALADGLPRLAAWRRALRERPSVAGAVAADYPARLESFLKARSSHLAGLIAEREGAAA